MIGPKGNLGVCYGLPNSRAKRSFRAEYGDILMSNITDFDRPNVVSLFTGAGGLDLGLEKAGFDIKVCVEWEHDRCETLGLNRPEWSVMEADIRRIKGEDILSFGGLQKEEVALISGGPSCQPFSKSAFWVKDRLSKIASDPRTLLLQDYVRVVKEIEPKAVLLENVHSLTFKPSRSVFAALTNSLEQLGYRCSWSILNSADYGVPQRRKRLFLVGRRQDLAFNFPAPTHFPKKSGNIKPAYVTAGEAIGDLDDGIIDDNEKIGGKWGHLLPLIPQGRNYLYLTEHGGGPLPLFKWRSRYWSFLLKLSPDEPSWTIQARPGPYTGPLHWRNRRLRLSEIKRLQTFPDDWRLFGDSRSKWSQVGDAVPPLLGRLLGKAILEQIFSYVFQ